MLKGISPLLSPDLLATLHRMGHGDEIVLGDAHFPGESLGARVIRADGAGIADLLDAILPLFELDADTTAPVVMMEPVGTDTADPAVGRRYVELLRKHAPGAPDVDLIDRSAFYERTRQAFAVVMTGDAAKYGNIILKKGVTPAA